MRNVGEGFLRFLSFVFLVHVFNSELGEKYSHLILQNFEVREPSVSVL